MGVCVSCGAVISSGSLTCASCGTPQRQQGAGGSGGFCGVCGATLSSKYAPCSKCGHTKTTYSITSGGAGASGHCGQCGTALTAKYAPCPKCGYSKTRYNPAATAPGSQYKNEGTGLILSIILGILGICGIGQIYAGKVGRGVAMLIVGIIVLIIGVATMGIGLIAYLAIFIWQIFDTKNLCREYNEYFSQNGRPPW